MQSNEDVILKMSCTEGASPLSLDLPGDASNDFGHENDFLGLLQHLCPEDGWDRLEPPRNP